MRLSLINFKHNKKCITEGYGRVFDIGRYDGDEVNDMSPSVLSLGRWKSPKGNNLLAGVNLNYLSDEQINRLQRNLQPILKDRNLKRRARKLRSLMPDIFNTAYRTYKKDAINQVTPNTLKFISVPTEPEKEKTTAYTDVPRPNSAPNSSIDAQDVEEPQIDSELSAQKTPEDENMREKPSKPETTKKINNDENEPRPDMVEPEEPEPEETTEPEETDYEEE